MSLFTAAQNGKLLARMKAFKDAVAKCLAKRPCAEPIDVGDRVVGLLRNGVVEEYLPEGVRAFARTVKGVDVTGKTVSVLWKIGEEIDLPRNEVVLESQFEAFKLERRLP